MFGINRSRLQPTAFQLRNQRYLFCYHANIEHFRHQLLASTATLNPLYLFIYITLKSQTGTICSYFQFLKQLLCRIIKGSNPLKESIIGLMATVTYHSSQKTRVCSIQVKNSLLHPGYCERFGDFFCDALTIGILILAIIDI